VHHSGFALGGGVTQSKDAWKSANSVRASISKERLNATIEATSRGVERMANLTAFVVVY
jgi:hypothetical protein